MNSLKTYLGFFLFICAITTKAQVKDTAYFQQKVDYTIHVKLNDITNELIGNEVIHYTNNSPHTLKFIFFHLYPNAYKNLQTSLAKQLYVNNKLKFYFSKDDDKGYIDSLNFKVNGKRAYISFWNKNIDITKLYLPEPLKPGETITISTPFHVKIPLGKFSRMGHIGQSYQISQWYPEPAVYDKDGWHQMPYLDQGEFYAEFGTYDVYITLPKNYVVGATGDLQNKSEIKWLNTLADSTEKLFAAGKLPERDSTGKIDLHFPESSSTFKTLHYHQEKVHDFAWFADKRYHVLKSHVKLPHTEKTVTTWAMFTNQEALLWKDAPTYINDALYYYSLWNGDYPYKQMTAVQGALSAGAGMEYPNVTIIGLGNDPFDLETTIMHEVGHQWFYGVLANNERDQAIMDEGINSFYQNRYVETKYPDANIVSNSNGRNGLLKFFDLDQYSNKHGYRLAYLLQARKKIDQPLDLTASAYTSANYGAMIYAKSILVFNYLQNYLGTDVFDSCMQTFFKKWEFKHVSLADLQKVFEQVSGKKLNWFFDDVISTNKKIDYKIGRLKKHDKDDSTHIQIKIKNKGGIKSPFSISALRDDSVIKTLWYKGTSKSAFEKFPKGKYDELVIDNGDHMPDINRKNNQERARGLFKKVEPPRLQFLFSLENPKRTQLFYCPIVAWNTTNKTMLGLALYNSKIPAEKFELQLAPMYSFATKNITGMGEIAYNFRTEGFFKDIRLGISGKSFSFQDSLAFTRYQKLTGKIHIAFRKSNPLSFWSSSLDLRMMNMGNFYTPRKVVMSVPPVEYDSYFYNVNELKFTAKSTNPMNPFNVSVKAQEATDMLKASLLVNTKFRYNLADDGLYFRLFIGRFLYNNNANPIYNFAVSQNPDYTYDELYFERGGAAGDLLSHQFVPYEGGFYAASNQAPLSSWLNTITVSSDIPHLHILSPFVQAGIGGGEIRDGSGNQVEEATDLLYDAGFAVTPIKGIRKFFSIYVPLVSSSKMNPHYFENVRFVLNFRLLNPVKYVRNFSFY